MALMSILKTSNLEMFINRNGVTALMHASKNGEDKIAEFLITNNADINAEDK